MVKARQRALTQSASSYYLVNIFHRRNGNGSLKGIDTLTIRHISPFSHDIDTYKSQNRRCSTKRGNRSCLIKGIDTKTFDLLVVYPFGRNRSSSLRELLIIRILMHHDSSTRRNGHSSPRALIYILRVQSEFHIRGRSGLHSVNGICTFVFGADTTSDVLYIRLCGLN